MPRYLVERTYTVDMDKLTEVATARRRSATIATPRSWEHSHVVVGTDGVPKSFCVYDAPDEQMVRDHSTTSATTTSRRSTRSRAM